MENGKAVCSGKLHQIIFFFFILAIGNDYFFRIKEGYLTIFLGINKASGISSGFFFHTGSYQRSLRSQTWHRLFLHVRTHQGAVGIIVIQKRNHRGGHGESLVGSHVHIIHIHTFNHSWVTVYTHFYIFINYLTLGINVSGGMGNLEVFLFQSIHITNLISNHAVFYFGIGRFNHAKIIYLGINGKSQDQTNVWSFGSMDRANASVVRRVNVTDFKARSLASKPARSERGQGSEIFNFLQDVFLRHEF